MEARVGEPSEDVFANTEERRRDRRLREDAELRALVAVVRSEDRRERLLEVFPLGFVGGDIHRRAVATTCRDSALERRGRAIGIVEIEDRRLGDEVGGAAAGGVLRVAFDLGGAVLVALHEETQRFAATARDGGEVLADPGDRVLGRPRVWKDLLDRTTDAAFEPEQRGDRGAELHEAATVERDLVERAFRASGGGEDVGGGADAHRELGFLCVLKRLGRALLLQAAPEDGSAGLVGLRRLDLMRTTTTHR